jgi:hypothetical protein
MNWRERRKLAYLICDFDDARLPYKTIECSEEDLVAMIVAFFNDGSKLIYPIKAYFVAIVYAHFLSKYFDEDFHSALNEPDLLPDMPNFTVYDEGKRVYDEVLKQIGDIEQYESIQKTLKYFKQEFLIEG